MAALGRTVSLTRFYPTRVRYLEFLQGLHAALQPPTYLEIGIRRGDSLALSRSSTIGIDPAFSVKAEAPADTALFRETSDEYFDYYRKRHAFWKMYGLNLPDEVLKKLYYKNALRIVPGIDKSAFPK